MKILQIHNFYTQPGGEDKVLEQEKTLLEENGHTVDQWTKSNIQLSFWDKMSLLLTSHWSAKAERSCEELFQEKSYDVVHVHNFFPQFSPSIFRFFRTHEIPCVMTLHNYRLVYPNGLLYHKGVDLRTISGSAYRVILDKVYRNSIIQTAVVAHMIEFNRKHMTWHKYVDRLICLTNFQKDILTEAGIPRDKMVVKPNFLNSTGSNQSKESEVVYFVFVGRLTEDKGVKELLNTWSEFDIPYALKIIGSGELETEVRQCANRNQRIEYLGQLPNEETILLLKGACALIFPSLWFEGFPMTILESFNNKVPVICTNIGGQNEIVEEGETGFKYKPGDLESLCRIVHNLAGNISLQREMGDMAYNKYQEQFSQQVNYNKLIAIYQDAIEASKQ